MLGVTAATSSTVASDASIFTLIADQPTSRQCIGSRRPTRS